VREMGGQMREMDGSSEGDGGQREGHTVCALSEGDG
jgi:hypothetical protein